MTAQLDTGGTMTRIIGAMAVVLLVVYIVPFLLYGGANALGVVQLPASASPRSFLTGVLISKMGTAVAFVLLFHVGAAAWDGRWLLYAAVWLMMFVSIELGDYVASRSTGTEAILGILSEIVYTPLSAFAVHALLRR